MTLETASSELSISPPVVEHKATTGGSAFIDSLYQRVMEHLKVAHDSEWLPETVAIRAQRVVDIYNDFVQNPSATIDQAAALSCFLDYARDPLLKNNILRSIGDSIDASTEGSPREGHSISPRRSLVDLMQTSSSAQYNLALAADTLALQDYTDKIMDNIPASSLPNTRSLIKLSDLRTTDPRRWHECSESSPEESIDDPDVWLTTNYEMAPEDLERLNDLTNAVDIEIFVLEAAKLIDKLDPKRYDAPDRSPGMLRDIILAQSVYIPVLESLRLDAMASKLNCYAEDHRLINSENATDLDRSSRILEQEFYDDSAVVNQVAVALSALLDEDVTFTYTPVIKHGATHRTSSHDGLITITGQDPEEKSFAVKVRLKEHATLARKLHDKSSDFIPGDIIGVKITVASPEDVAYIFEMVHRNLNNLTLGHCPNQNGSTKRGQAYEVRGMQPFKDAVTDCIEQDASTKDVSVSKNESLYEQAKAMLITPASGRMEIQILTEESSQYARFDSPHWAHKSNVRNYLDQVSSLMRKLAPRRNELGMIRVHPGALPAAKQLARWVDILRGTPSNSTRASIGSRAYIYTR